MTERQSMGVAARLAVRLREYATVGNDMSRFERGQIVVELESLGTHMERQVEQEREG